MSGVEFEIPSAALKQLAKVFGSDIAEGNEELIEDSDEDFDEDAAGLLAEGVATKRLVGHIVLRGFDDGVVRSVPDELKFRIQATKMSSRVRVIIDVKV